MYYNILVYSNIEALKLKVAGNCYTYYVVGNYMTI